MMIKWKMVRREMMKVLLKMIIEKIMIKEMIKEMIIFKIKIIEMILEAEFCRMKIRIDEIVEVGM